MLLASSEVGELKQKLRNEILLRKAAEAEVDNLKNQLNHWISSEVFVVLVNFYPTDYFLLLYNLASNK